MPYSCAKPLFSLEGQRNPRERSMDSVLANTLKPIADELATVSQAQAQASPRPTMDDWCGQEVVEHLILTFKKSTEELESRLKSKTPPANGSTLYQLPLKIQLLWFGSMTAGTIAPPSLVPGKFVPQDGPALSARLLAEAEQLSKTLAQSEAVFGKRPCGDHPIYGPLSAAGWRKYHELHCRQHATQLKAAINFARAHRAKVPEAVSKSNR